MFECIGTIISWIGFVFIIYVVGYFLLERLLAKKFTPPPTGAAILISGAGTGFGKLTSLKMAQMGYNVYSGVLSEEEGDQLKQEFQKQGNTSGGSLTPLILDITNETHVRDALKRLKTDLKDTGLHMLLNNAGIANNGPIELQPINDFKKTFEVNLLGHVHMTQVFIPLMRQVKHPRIVNVTSIAGRVAAARMAAYNASKFALEGVTDCLRRELYSQDFSLSAIEPGFTRTQIISNGLEYAKKMNETVPRELLEKYNLLTFDTDKVSKRILDSAQDPVFVVDAIVHAFTSPTPQTRYLVGKEAKIIALFAWLVPDCVIDQLSARAESMYR
jgi:NAD(P)-dependent dehydrogenase (short-subunit alcohol dehydrogenase family)